LSAVTPYNATRYKFKATDFFPSTLRGSGFRFAHTLIEIYREIQYRHLDLTLELHPKGTLHPVAGVSSNPPTSEPRSYNVLKAWPDDYFVGTDTATSTRWPHQIFHTYRLLTPVLWDMLVYTLGAKGQPERKNDNDSYYHWVLSTEDTAAWNVAKEYFTSGDLCKNPKKLKDPKFPTIAANGSPGDNPFADWRIALEAIRAILRCMKRLETCLLDGTPPLTFTRLERTLEMDEDSGFRDWVDTSAVEYYYNGQGYGWWLREAKVSFKGFSPSGSCPFSPVAGVLGLVEITAGTQTNLNLARRTPYPGIGIGVQCGNPELASAWSLPPLPPNNSIKCRPHFYSFCGAKKGKVHWDFEMVNLFGEPNGVASWKRLEDWLKLRGVDKPGTWDFEFEITPTYAGAIPVGDSCSIRWEVECDAGELTGISETASGVVVNASSVSGRLPVEQLYAGQFPPASDFAPNPPLGSVGSGWVMVRVPWGTTQLRVTAKLEVNSGDGPMWLTNSSYRPGYGWLTQWGSSGLGTSWQTLRTYGFEADFTASRNILGVTTYTPPEED